ncbi:MULTISPECIES: fatty acid--CoA ligase [unclassified Bradyrhizobium]|uniref:fatty acid--CoA ligase n=1 Tax=unclassified Bradyrhizobium TaxID=2631580 RepID=UPI00211DA9CB|nr:MULTISPECIES: fatty acid--CoA ligase [unclassified Bradyrhizobium]MDD1533598.1 acyl-CoA synthetase [Bradyrhizobium sp. WBOS8]MDD1586642.1 acyl-CoA synthetase [Bradyrhizobium sp. WBOS4]UUO47956.1 acyl-CoA synthetase [Bradyrhizobium sp. WBOS04]UUO61638.1 acyl-CoA synthetase [Bradyrhizobium sp. WBOS08]
MSTQKLANLADMVRERARSRGDAVAYEFEGRLTSFAEFDIETNKVANALLAMGVGRGNRIAYLGKNSDFYFKLLMGAMKAGVVMAPVNWRLAGPEVAFIVEDCKAPVLFVGPEFITLVRQIRDQIPGVRTIVTTEGGAPEWQDFAAWRDAQSGEDPKVPIDSKDIAIQLYTSGTTGKPKGAMLSHANFLNLVQSGNAEDKPEWNRWSHDDVSLVAMPVFHIGGSGWGVMGLYHGARGVIAREFDPTKVLDFFEHSGITKLFMVPAAMQFVVRQPRARTVDFSRLKYMLYGASPIPAALLKECIEVFKCGFVQLYGMTETTGTIVALPPEDHVEGLERMRSAGKALPGVEIAILDVNGEPLPPRQVGEIATRSGSNMAGYWNLPEATAATLRRDGWLRTGDAGYMDEDGYLYIHDRIKDMIISGGENIYPAEVESALCDHPDVAEAAVIGVPDDKWGEAVKAVVVMKPGKQATATDIINFTRTRIAGYKTPKSVEFLPALPRNPSGKILRRQLREPYWAGKDRRVN